MIGLNHHACMVKTKNGNRIPKWLKPINQYDLYAASYVLSVTQQYKHKAT